MENNNKSKTLILMYFLNTYEFLNLNNQILLTNSKALLVKKYSNMVDKLLDEIEIKVG